MAQWLNPYYPWRSPERVVTHSVYNTVSHFQLLFLSAFQYQRGRHDQIDRLTDVFGNKRRQVHTPQRTVISS